MLRHLACRLGNNLSRQLAAPLRPTYFSLRNQNLQFSRCFGGDLTANWPESIKSFLEKENINKPTLIQEKTLPIALQKKDLVGIARTGSGKTLAFIIPPVLQQRPNINSLVIQSRSFHAPGSKIHYMDFRHRFTTHQLRLHLLIIRRQKMKKHKRRKFRAKFKCLLAKRRLKREIAKEKVFRVELLSYIKRAEQFDPREYALKKIAEINSRPKELSKQERLEEIKELIRVNRYQVDYIKPKHKRA